MVPPRFVHLHLHTDYSLLDGACEIKSLVEQAARLGMPAVAVTDHGNMFAAANFYHEAVTRGVKPILGCEMYVARGSHREKSGDVERSNHLVLLCETTEGYQNLKELVSAGFLDGFYYKPRVDYDLLARHSRGLIALSACLRGEVAEAFVQERYDRAREAAYCLRDVFGKGNFFLEVQDQGLEIEKRVNRELVRLSKESGIPLVATNDCHYLTRADARAQDVLLCIQTGKTVADQQRMRFATEEFYFKSAHEMAEIFRDLPDALERTVAIAERCCVRIDPVANPFPRFQVPEGHTLESYFEEAVRRGFAERLPHLERLAKEGRLRHSLAEYEARLSDEIVMIKRMRYVGYFLIVWDFIRYARAQGIPVGPGRGSAAGSLVSYALRITDVDPLEYGLLFERFLNPERVSMPDIDIDFCMRRRGEVIEYVRQTYGEENVAQIITFGTLGAKAVLKDVARALELPYGEADRLAKLVPNQLNITLDEALEQSTQLRQMVERDPRVKDLVEVARRLEGLARHASTHAAGVVISPEPLRRVVPLYKTNREEITTQYDMKALERLGLLKMDLLGLTTLTVVHDTVRLIQQNKGALIDLEQLPLDDPEVYRLFSRAATTGIFQFESHGMREILRRYEPSRLEDLTALNALYRPGPIQGGMIDDFIDRKHGRKRVSYELAELREILEETYGVILYQEQVMQIANRLAGFSLGEADILRRAMGKKNREEMAAQRAKFLAGCRARHVPPKKAERIFDLMAEFAGYGFNKSHACAYALLAYQTAFLKVHYPVEFMAALLTSEIANTEKLVKYIHEARSMGIQVLPPDIHESGLYFTPVGDAIRFGLAAIKNVGEASAQGILDARGTHAHFRTVDHLCEAVDSRLLNRRVLESLIKSGALDRFAPNGNRARLWAAIDQFLEHGQKVWRDRSTGQTSFLGLAQWAGSSQHPAEPLYPAELPDAEDWTEQERLAHEYSVLGFYISGHPLARYAGRLAGLAATELGALEGCANGEEVRVAGVVVNTRSMRSRKGDRWAIVTLQDMSGMVELLVFPESFARLESLIASGAPLLVKGRVNHEEVGSARALRVVASDARLLDEAAAPAPAARLHVRVRLDAIDDSVLLQLDQLFEGKPGPCPVAFELVRPDGSVATLEAERRVRADRELLAAVRGLCGEDAVALE
jgi:DNA polymerase-3 subunit alpha